MRTLTINVLLGFFGTCLLAGASAVSPTGFIVPSSTVRGNATGGGNPPMETYLTNPGGGMIAAAGDAGSASLKVALSTTQQSATATATASENPNLIVSLDQSGALAEITYYVIAAPVSGTPSKESIPVLVSTSLDTKMIGANADYAGSATASVEEFGLLLQAQTYSDGTTYGLPHSATASQVVDVEVGAVNEIYMFVNAVAFGGETAIADIDPTFTIEGPDAQSYELLYSPEISTRAPTVAPEPASFCLSGLMLLAGGAAWRRKKSA